MMNDKNYLRWASLTLALMIAGGTVNLAAQEQRQRVIFTGGEDSWIGVEVKDVTSATAQQMKLPGDYGAIVISVKPDSPAAKAGIQKGDVILMLSGEKVLSVSTLRRLVRETPPGRTVEAEISRDGAVQNLEITPEKPKGNAFFYGGPMFKGGPPWIEAEPRFKVGPMPNLRSNNPGFNFRLFSGHPILGISADDLTPQLAKFFGVTQGKGVLVREVTEGSPAAKAGLKAGDVIIKVGSKGVGSVEDLRDALGDETDQPHKVLLTIVRNHEEQMVTVQIEPVKWGLPDMQAWQNLGIDRQQAEQLARQAKAMAAEYGAKSGEYQNTLERMQKQLQQELQPLKENVKREMDQLKLQMRDQIKHEMDLQKQRKSPHIV
jgi:membrane-associated protease RseP (regulator of RpoE activity)